MARAAARFFVSVALALNVMQAVAHPAVLKDAVRSRDARLASGRTFDVEPLFYRSYGAIHSYSIWGEKSLSAKR